LTQDTVICQQAIRHSITNTKLGEIK
jgi:hypothetical protein